MKKAKKQKTDKLEHAAAQTLVLEPTQVKHDPAITPSEIPKKLGPCEVINCGGSPEMMRYEGRTICSAHFDVLCKEREEEGGHVRLEDLFNLKPIEEKKEKSKKIGKRGRRANPDSPWVIAHGMIIKIFGGESKSPLKIKEVLAELITDGWQAPSTNNNLETSLYDLLTKMIKEGHLVKAGRGLFGKA